MLLGAKIRDISDINNFSGENRTKKSRLKAGKPLVGKYGLKKTLCSEQKTGTGFRQYVS